MTYIPLTGAGAIMDQVSAAPHPSLAGRGWNPATPQDRVPITPATDRPPRFHSRPQKPALRQSEF